MSGPHPTWTDLTWTDDGQPRSGRYGDVYFSAHDGLAESRAVFLEGCGLPDAWTGRNAFTVAELGFGTGLNIAALLDLWRRAGPPDAHLHIFSVEAHPIAAADARRALALWPELADAAALLTARWPGAAPGVHRVELPEYAATLDLAVAEVGEALEGWTGRADAWFLDGFSPALNPAMWRDEVLALVAARSAPSARAATFTVAGQVRRGLAAAGFTVEKRPGYGRKRERLEARLGPPPRRVAIVGAGVAGAAAARAVRALGGEAIVIEAQAPGAGGSGFPAALMTPRLDAGLGPPARLFAQAFERAVQLYETVPDAVIARGVLQLARTPRDLERFAKVADSGLFASATLRMLTPDETAARLGEPAGPALDQASALVVAPAVVLEAWLGATIQASVTTIVHGDAGWRLLDASGAQIAQADAVILAAALGVRHLANEVTLQPVRGQASWTDAATARACAWGGYVAPTRDGLLFGATHDRDDTALDLRAADHDRNRAALGDALPDLAERLAGAALHGRVAIRAATRDRLPLAGADAEGLLLLTGFGSRGFSWAPLLAEHVAALAMDAASPLAAELAALVDPRRRSAAIQNERHNRNAGVPDALSPGSVFKGQPR